MKRLNVYVVDDDVFYLKSVILGLSAEYSDSIFFRYFFNGNELIAKLRSGEEQADVVLLDYNLDSKDLLHGVELIREIKKINSKIEVVVVSAQTNNQTALTVIKAGAISYVQKGAEILNDLRVILNKAIRIKLNEKEKKPMLGWVGVLLAVVVALVIFLWWKIF